MKICYRDIPYFDKSILIVRKKVKNDTNGFIYANEIKYKIVGEKERKHILCQESSSTADNIEIVIVLINKKEFNK
ncbi:Hypothetical protein SRAE_1000217500 [Strongyloides ratti]|uniref:Uncharacterized protein n=1 Tax=Strongyloides ratti TaxID=34506 RepID=A0A090MWM0_STRRB|nr:Hypothetical protein SRAE_1000217500 [Strongyloides ratti]CEF63919.1 Hypothetical protein SRAE_1000217500 [Strongyloides ratti]